MNLMFGLLAPKLHEQIKCSANIMAHHQRDADYVTALRMRGILTRSETRKAEMRIIKGIESTLKRMEEI